jgi:deoxyxylulose-5-phosphate synthase
MPVLTPLLDTIHEPFDLRSLPQSDLVQVARTAGGNHDAAAITGAFGAGLGVVEPSGPALCLQTPEDCDLGCQPQTYLHKSHWSSDCIRKSAA